MSSPLVSACIGTYNREKYVKEALDSMFAQTYPNVEVIVVDDASTDRTVDIVKSYGDRLRLIERTVNSGVCQVTRNQAIKAGQGKYTAFLDSDDAWYPEKLAKQVAFMEAHPEIPMCHTYSHVINEASEVIGIRHEGSLPPTGDYLSALIERCWITISSVMIRSDIFDSVGGYFNEDLFFRIGEDYEFFLRVAARHPIGLVPEVLCRYRKSAAGITAGNWRYTPRVVPLHKWVLANKALWYGKVPRSEPVAALVDACAENSQFWRDRGYPGRALYFAGQALLKAPAARAAWSHLARSAVRSIWRRPRVPAA